MFGDDESIFDRIWRQISERFQFLAPVWIVNRSESLTILDYRPTFFMFLTAVGFVLSTFGFVYFLFKANEVDSLGLWVTGISAVVCLGLSFRGTIREAYYFDKTGDTYAFVRQFIYRKEVIEGALSQFTGAFVKTEQTDESESYYVVLKQEGLFLTGVSEQSLRLEVPIFNSFSNEARIANAITSFLSSNGQNLK